MKYNIKTFLYIILIMIFPIRCFTCGKVIGDCWTKYLEIVEDEKNKEQQSGEESYQVLNKNYAMLNDKLKTPQSKALDQLHMTRYCCRRHFLTHVDI